jgi:pyruvate/2-oxoglutarate dehydrogenase complex dihydrolipoamide acyltransferase (E2) component
MVWDGNTKLLDKYKAAGFETSSHAPYNEEKFGAPSQSLRDYWSSKLGWKEGDPYPGVTFTKLDTPFKASDLWHDETGTYTSGQFMKFLAKNKLMSKAGSETLDAAAKKDFVPGWAEVSQFLTPEDRAQASKSVQKNVVDLVNKFNPEWVSDAAKAGSAAKGWYSRATGLIQHMFGDEAHRFTNFVASLSPQKDVEQNFTDALNFYNMWQDAGKPLGPDNEKAIRDLTERAEVGMSGQVARNQLYENLVNEVQPTGPKVSNFARNLKGNMDAVTKDRWMSYLFGNNERMFRWFKEGSPKPAVHLAADALIRAVGQSINMLPAEVQETSWSFLRTVVNLTEKEKISPKEAIGRVNDTLIREGASELTRLIADSPKVQSALNRLATATGDERFRADNLQNSPRFKQLLQEHQEQPSTGGGAGAINRAGAERGVKQAIKARSEISQAKKAKAAAPPVEKPAQKKAPKDKATEFNPEDMSENIRPALFRQTLQRASLFPRRVRLPWPSWLGLFLTGL